MQPQCKKVLAALRQGPITTMDMIRDHGITRTAARIGDLREAGYNITSELVDVRDRAGNTHRVARYTLNKQQAAA